MLMKQLRIIASILIICLQILGYRFVGAYAIANTASNSWDNISGLAEVGPDEVKQGAVNKAWPALQNEILNDLTAYGFGNKDEVDSVVLGPMFRLYKIDKVKVKQENMQSFSQVLKFEDEWLFVLYVNNIPKCLMSVFKQNGEYILSRSPEPADHYIKALEAFKNKVDNKGQKIKPLVTYDGIGYLLVGKEDNNEWVIPAFPTQENTNVEYLGYTNEALQSNTILDHYRKLTLANENIVESSKNDIKIAGAQVFQDANKESSSMIYLITGSFVTLLVVVVTLYISLTCIEISFRYWLLSVFVSVLNKSISYALPHTLYPSSLIPLNNLS